MNSLSGKKQNQEHIAKRVAARIRNGNAQPRVSRPCSLCGKPYSVRTGFLRVKTCSKKCGYEFRKKYTVSKRWRGGEFVCKDGYKMVRFGKWYIKEHRLKMSEKTGRELTRSEVVHHWDENRVNNELENLALFRHQAAHKRLHLFATRHGIPVLELKFEQPWLTP